MKSRAPRSVSYTHLDVYKRHVESDGSLLSLDEVEALHIQRVLAATRGHKGHTCDILKISRPALDRKIQKYQLQLPAGREE